MGRLRKRLEQYQIQPQNQPTNYTEEQQSPLAQEYDKLQEKAQNRHKEEIKLLEKNNPNTLHKEIVSNPSHKGRYPITIMGRPIDMSKLENYLVYKISPRTITTLIRYGDARAIEDIKGYSKKRPIRFKGGIIWIILGAIVILILGYILMSTDVTAFFSGMFGGI